MKRFILCLAVLLQAALVFGQNYRSTAEVFIEVPDRGNYSVRLDNDLIESSKGRFRFFDIGSSSATLVITRDNQELFRRKISIPQNSRLIASYTQRSGLRTLLTLPLFDRGQYALDNWDRSIYTTGRGDIDYQEVMTAEEFNRIMGMVKREMFEDNQLKIMKTAISTSMITTSQLITFLRIFPFDNKKLDLAKYAYPYIADRKKFIAVTEVFDFQSNKNEILNLINKQ